jgi:hypothetical protein
MAASEGTPANGLGTSSAGEFVEVGLLLPASWASTLMELSRRRSQSVGQILRGMIDRGLTEASTADRPPPPFLQSRTRLSESL